MFAEGEFIYLSLLPSTVLHRGRFIDPFMKAMGWKSPREAAKNLNQFQRALASYSKRNKFDNVQLEAVGKAQKLYNFLRRYWLKENCAITKRNNKDGELVSVCLKHGNKSECGGRFEEWFRSVSY